MLSKFFDLGLGVDIDVQSILHEWRDELSGYNVRLEERSIKISKDRYDPYLSLHYYKLQTLKEIAEDYNTTGLLIPLKSSFRLKPIPRFEREYNFKPDVKRTEQKALECVSSYLMIIRPQLELKAYKEYKRYRKVYERVKNNPELRKAVLPEYLVNWILEDFIKFFVEKESKEREELTFKNAVKIYTALQKIEYPRWSYKVRIEDVAGLRVTNVRDYDHET